MNSASLRFIPLDQMKKEGYGHLVFLFAEKMRWRTLRLAGGCYWGLEALLAKLPGVIETEVGKTQGAETVHLLFDPKKTSAQNIYLEFFRYHDPTTQNRQGNDVGPQYRSAIFVATPAEKEEALKAKARVEASGHWKKPLTTEITLATDFQRDDEFHQKYLEKNPRGYTCHYARPFKF
jgi:peptide methionine sulfoxide reductase msrA/msrB